MTILEQYLIDNAIKYSQNTLDKFERYFELLIEWNNKFNLTAITEKEDVFIKHFIDSIPCVKDLKQNATVIDIGSGAGFPSIPLAILRPDVTFTLIDSLNKRVNFLLEVKTVLSLDNITAHHSRAEDFIADTRGTYDYAVARAVAPLNILLEYLAPFVKIGGEVIAYKSAGYLDELAVAENAIRILRLSAAAVREYALPTLEDKRYLLVFTKNSACNILYPRGGNLPRKLPL